MPTALQSLHRHALRPRAHPRRLVGSIEPPPAQRSLRDGNLGILDKHSSEETCFRYREARNLFDRQRKRRLIDVDPGTEIRSHFRPVGHVMVDRLWLRREVFGDQHPWKMGEPRKNLRDLLIGEVLQDLSNQAQIRGRQLVRDDVRAEEADTWPLKLAAMMLDQFRNYVHADVLRLCSSDNSPPHGKVATAKINHAPDPVLTDKAGHGRTVQVGGRAVGASPSIEPLSILTPHLLAIYL